MSEDKQVDGPVPEAKTEGSDIERSSFMERVFMGFRSGPVFHPVFEKFEREHVTQLLENSFERERAEQKARSSDRWFRLTYVALVAGLFVFLTLLLLPNNTDLYFQILQGLGLFLAGFAGGYGVRSYQRDP